MASSAELELLAELEGRDVARPSRLRHLGQTRLGWIPERAALPSFVEVPAVVTGKPKREARGLVE
jgi:hypothetical protein